MNDVSKITECCSEKDRLNFFPSHSRARNTTSYHKSWLNDDGSVKPQSELKTIAKNWGMSTWSDYLSFLDYREPVLREKLMSANQIDYYNDKGEIKTLSEIIARREENAFTKVVKIALESLTDRQRQIVLMRFEDSLSMVKIAEISGLKKTTVQSHLDRAITKLKENLEILLGEEIKS